MAIFPGGKSVRIDSPRHLTIRYARRALAARQREARRLRRSVDAEEADSEPEIDLPPGQQKLNSYWAPGLQAGQKHVVTVTQTIEAAGQSLPLTAKHEFFVDAPQFSLPDGSVHSTYPPAGYSDSNRILPHVVLTDPHLPWERLGSPQLGTNAELKEHFRLMAAGLTDAAPVRNRVPWLVMFSFTQDELRLTPELLESIFSGTSDGVIKPVKQSSTMTVNMSIDDLWKLSSNVTTPVTKDLGPENMKDSRGDFIFVKSELFNSLFSTFDASGNPSKPSKPNTLQYQWLSHVRTINGEGMALAGVEDTAVFSIVLGNRSGPLDNVTSTTMCAHLVSIEGVENKGFPTSGQQYVAMCSLHSWNYTVLPPDTLNVPDAFEHLGRTLNVLRAPEKVISDLNQAGDKISQRVAQRLTDGYTLVKYYTQTGEPTVAFYRGPLVPTNVQGLDNLSQCSNTGIDLQILDKTVGVMDITYSVAWQIGRTLALGDEVFTAALGRYRTLIHGSATKAVKLQTVKELGENTIRTREELLGDLPNMIKGLAAIHLDKGNGGNGGDGRAPAVPGQPSFSPGGAKKRWFRPKLGHTNLPNLSFTSPSFEAKYPEAALKAALSLAGSRADPSRVYNETENPQSTDCQIVFSWLLDRMFLAGVPGHCLVADPSFVESESLRFFGIDKYWVDAMIDGALSLGNHSLIDDERVAIKQAFNKYLEQVPEGGTIPPQLPAYGFYLRSDLVTMFPDLRVEVLADGAALAAAGQDPPTGAPLLRHEIVTDGVMMALMDRLPGSAEFSKVTFTQPAHQQRFAVARGVSVDEVKADILRQYTVDQATRETDKDRHIRLDQIINHPTGDGSQDAIFVWGSQPGQGLNDLHIMRLPRFPEQQLSILKAKMPTYDDGGTQKPYFDDDAATSALFAMQMNDPNYKLIIDMSDHPPQSTLSSLSEGGGGVGKQVRTLKRLTPAQVKGMPVGKAVGNLSLPAPVSDSTVASFQRHADYVPLSATLSANLAPHVRAMRPMPAAKLSIPTSEVGDPGTYPQYKLTVGTNNINDWNIVRVGDARLRRDVLFAVNITQGASQYRLVEFDVQITLGTLSTQLMPTYDGTGAFMLTNFRFNVLPQILEEDGQRLLRLRVLPRAAKGWVDATTVHELSFLLGLGTINDISDSPHFVNIHSWAFYIKDPNNPSVDPKNLDRIDHSPTMVTLFR